MAYQIITSDTIGTGVRVNLGTTDMLVQLAGSTIGSTTGDAVVATGSYHRIDIHGNVVGYDTGISLGDSGSDDTYQAIEIHAGGLVHGRQTGIMMMGYDSSLENHGTIYAMGYGVVLTGISTYSTTTLTNTGTIRADYAAIARGTLSTERLVITNTGLIKGDVYSFSASGSSAVEEITNHGRMIGAISFSAGNDLYDGRKGSVTGRVQGGDGNDRLYGGTGSEELYGDAGNDTLLGGGGNDILNGGTGADRMEGGAGNDRFFVDNAGDVVVELSGQGTDTVEASISYRLGANVENLILTGSGKINGDGNSAANTITGNSGANILTGLAGNDTLKGEAGNDRLIGGAGADKLYGGAGADRFVFTALSDSTTAASGRDMIYDFSRSQGDRIDLSAIDANTKSSGNQAFSFIGEKAFSGKAGELRYAKSGGDTFVYGDVNGDKKADFAIAINPLIDLVKGDFIL